VNDDIKPIRLMISVLAHALMIAIMVYLCASLSQNCASRPFSEIERSGASQSEENATFSLDAGN